MEREFYGVFWIKPPGLAHNKVLLVANAIDDVGTKSNSQPDKNTTLKPDKKTLYDNDGEIIQVASKWIKAGRVSEAEKEIAYYYEVCSAALDMPIEAMPAIIDYYQTDKQGAKNALP